MGYVEQLLTNQEYIVARQRQHWVVIVRAFTGTLSELVVLLVLVALWRGLNGGRGPLWSAPLRQYAAQVQPYLDRIPAFVPLLLLAWYLLAMSWRFLSTVIRWLNVVNLVTNRRVIQVHGVLSKTSLDSSLEKVNDVLLSEPLLGRLLGFGHLRILTASEAGVNTMRYLPAPLEFKRLLLEAKGYAGASGPITPTAPFQAQSIAERLAQLQALYQQGLISPQEFATKREQLLRQL